MPYYNTVNQVLEKKVSVLPSVWTALRVGDDNAIGRKFIGIFNRTGSKSAAKMFITTDNTMDPADCRVIKIGGERIFPYSHHVTLYGMSAGSGSCAIVVTEELGS